MGANDDYSLMQEVFAVLPSAVVVIDEQGVIVRANERAAQLLDCPELEGKSWLEVMAQAFRPQNDDGNEISTRTGRRLQVTTTKLRTGQLIHMTDLTQTRLLQDKLAHMERLSSLGRMAASLAHQIRTPLSAAILYAANLGNANLMPTARKRFQEKLMSRLEALEAQVSDMTVGELDAATLISATENNVAAVVNKSQVLLETEAPHGAIAILGNSSALVGALSNLVANAVEAGATHIILRLTADEDQVSLAVANNGPIIPEELKTKIFEPFFTSKSAGTGLGLAVVTAVTKVHQGTLTLSSWNDTFATVFTITIPRAPAALAPQPAAPTEPTGIDPSTAPIPTAAAPIGTPQTDPAGINPSAAQSTELTAAQLTELTNAQPVVPAAAARSSVPAQEVGGETRAQAWSVTSGRTLPPTAADISAQAATDANSATSAAFTAYLKRQQEKNGLAAYAATRSTTTQPSAPQAVPEALSVLGATDTGLALGAQADEAPSGDGVAAEPQGQERTAALPSDLKTAFSQEEFESWLAKVSEPKG